uniref:Conserved plasma membrane protein n=1 Tax=Toxocara canis TaxID=6265 RepID=A0A183V8E0_TOXCA
LFSTSYCVVNGILYYKYVRPLRQEERELLERELIEADKAGFAIKYSHLQGIIVYNFSLPDPGAKLNALRRFLQVINSRWQYIFLFGVAAGAGFELFKVHFKFRGVSYYSVYKKNQLKKQLGSFEAGLRDLDNLIANSPEFADIPSSSTSS